jgi:signal transduction histidine kinase
MIIWLIVLSTGTIDSIRNKESEAATAIRMASVAVESTNSISDLRRLITKLGAGRAIKEVYLLDLESLEVVTSNRNDNEKVIPENLEKMALEHRQLGILSNDWVEALRSQEVVVAEEIIIDSFSHRDLHSGRYLLMMKFVITIFDQHLFVLFAVYTAALVCALGLFLFIQKSILTKLFLNPFHLFVQILKTWNDKSYEELKEFTGHGEITELKNSFLVQYEKLELERLKSTQNAKLASLGEMSAGIAHEINNPLAIISGAVGLLSKFLDNPEKLSSKVETIKKSCDRIARIVKGLQKFSRSGDAASRQPHVLSKIVNEATYLTEIKSKLHSTPVTTDCKTDAYVFCNEVEIEQVLVNLISNAIDAVKTRPDKWVKVALYDDDNSVVLRVTDAGPGIPENVRAKLFDPFFTTKKVGEGTGLGLSITKGILDEHKATITVVADSPNTCFEIRFTRAGEMKNAA